MSGLKKPGSNGATETSGPVEDCLDSMLERLAENGELPNECGEEEEIPKAPSTTTVSKERLDAGRLRVMRILFADVLRDARTPPRDEWFGAWLKGVRSRSRLSVDEVAICCHLRPAEWQSLEERPVQVASPWFTEHVLKAILELFTHRLSDAETQIERGLGSIDHATLAPVQRRRTGEQVTCYVDAPLLRQPPPPASGRARRERVRGIIERTRALLLADEADKLL